MIGKSRIAFRVDVGGLNRTGSAVDVTAADDLIDSGAKLHFQFLGDLLAGIELLHRNDLLGHLVALSDQVGDHRHDARHISGIEFIGDKDAAVHDSIQDTGLDEVVNRLTQRRAAHAPKITQNLFIGDLRVRLETIDDDEVFEFLDRFHSRRDLAYCHIFSEIILLRFFHKHRYKAKKESTMSKITASDFAAMTVSYQQYSYDYTLNSLHQIGIENIDFWGGTPHYYRFDHSDDEARRFLKELKRKAQDLGMKYVVYTPETLAYPYSITDPNKKTVQRTIDYFRLCMDDALTLGTDSLFINTGTGLRDVPVDQSMATCIEAISKICEDAQSKGVTMLLEQLQPYESNICYNISAIRQIVDAVKSPALKLCIDLTAMDVAGENLNMYFDSFGKDMIGLIHFSDSHHEICGTGNLPLKEYIETLEKYDYDSYVDFEINDSIYWEDPHTPHLQSFEYVRQLLLM